MEVPFKLLIGAIILVVIMPPVYIGINSYSTSKTIQNIEAEMDMVENAIHIISDNEEGTRMKKTLDISDGSFSKLDYIKIGDKLGGQFDTTIRYKLAGEREVSRSITPNIPVTSTGNDVFTIGTGTNELIFEQRSFFGHDFVVVKRESGDANIDFDVVDVWDWVGDDYTLDLFASPDDIGFKENEVPQNGPSEITINVRNTRNFNGADIDRDVTVTMVDKANPGNPKKITKEYDWGSDFTTYAFATNNVQDGGEFEFHIDPADEIHESNEGNNIISTQYVSEKKIFISNMPQAGARGPNVHAEMILDHCVGKYIEQNLLTYLPNQNFKLTDDPKEANVNIIIGNPDRNSKAAQLNAMTLMFGVGWGYTPQKQIKVGLKESNVPFSGLVGKVNLDNVSNILIYGKDFAGTIAAARTFLSAPASFISGSLGPTYCENNFTYDLVNGKAKAIENWNFLDWFGLALIGTDFIEEAMEFNFPEDIDNDNLTNAKEKVKGTDPYVWDTDFDGMSDSMETELGLDPTNAKDRFDDYDNDGLLNWEEMEIYGSDINNKNTDGDAIDDGEDVKMGLDPVVRNDFYAYVMCGSSDGSFAQNADYMYHVLNTKYNFTDIYYLSAFPNYPNVDGNATWMNVRNGITTWLGNRADSNDVIFIYFSSHGGGYHAEKDTMSGHWDRNGDEGNEFRETKAQHTFDGENPEGEFEANSWGGVDESICVVEGRYTDDDLREDLNSISYKRLIFIRQGCFSGGLIDDISNDNTIICTAATEVEFSYGGTPYSEFSNNFINALYGKKSTWDINDPDHIKPGGDVDADTNNDGKVTIYEAYIFAKDRMKHSTSWFDDNGNSLPNYYSQRINNDATDGALSKITYLPMPL